MFGLDEKKQPLDTTDNASMDSSSLQDVRPFTRNQVLLCSTHGKIYAIHKKDGGRCWRQDFPTGALGGIVSIFVTDDDTVIVGGNGKTASLDLFTGTPNWVNKMKGFGYDEVGVIASPSRYLAPQDTITPAAPPSYDDVSHTNEKQMIYGCSSGKVLAIDPATGEEAWRFNCPKGGFNIPSVLVEPPSQEVWPFQVIYVGCGRWVYCLASVSGELQWAERITNSKFGLGFMCLATPWSSRLAAESHTSFSATPHAQHREMERRRNSNS
ncbi:quinon protein alcohol dehydrogenase-like superfamily [Chlamydoabsidia padenii]|nr:quinon protein alcohol dehydrogenase-like superfamily [Chlamydoabsidia padenii]